MRFLPMTLLRPISRTLTALLLLAGPALACAQVGAGDRTTLIITVDPSGKGDFTSIQAAINHIDSRIDQSTVIRIKKGVYTEKVYIDKNNVTLVGESRDSTILTQAIARDAWRCDHTDDWGVATLNLRGS